MITFLVFIELHFLPFFPSWRVPPTGTVDHQIFGKPFNKQDCFLVLNIEGIKISPQGLLFESFFDSMKGGLELFFTKITLQEKFDSFLLNLFFFLFIILV